MSRSSVGKSSVLLFVLLLVVGCQLRPIGPSRAPVSTAANVTAKSTNQVEIWGQVPKLCLCRGEPLGRVAAQLQDAQLPVTFSVQPPVEGWQRFSVTFDPAQVSRQQVEKVLAAAGAQVVPAPH
jgi:hypothetical protein